MAMVELPDRIPDLWRVRVLAVGICLGLLAILGRLWYLQIAHGAELLEASVGNQRRLIRRVPPRGQIQDTKGRVLATNRHQIVVSVVPNEIKRNPGTLSLLASLLGQSREDLEETIEHDKVTPFDPVRVQVDIGMELATRLEEQRMNLPGVMVGPEPMRYYPDGPLFGHLLGQVGQIPPNELKARKGEGYRPGDFCGKLGIEKAFDPMLRGTNGGREIEVDARGRMRREVDNTDPIPGATLTLTVDRDLQKIAYEELSVWAGRGKPGAAVALDPRTGAVLALASVPSYDPNLFVKGISSADWKKIQSDPLLPQINRAVAGDTAPGSTFKLITAAAGLDTGTISPSDRVFCGGAIYLGRWLKHCHKHGGHGSVNLTEAIADSCDVYFYRLGQRLGPDKIAAYARRFGLGQRTGIDLPRVETTGTVPDPAWKLRKRHQEWVGGETVDYAIGQAMLTCTPLQMCRVTAAIANGGTLYRPQVVRMVTTYDNRNRPMVISRMRPEATGHLNLSGSILGEIVQGMRAVMQPGGTGARSAIPGLTIAGKTGTAQRHHDGGLVDSAWFVGYAPVEDPRIAVCVYVQNAGHGGEAAAPIARKMIAHYFGIKVDNAEPMAASD